VNVTLIRNFSAERRRRMRAAALLRLSLTVTGPAFDTLTRTGANGGRALRLRAAATARGFSAPAAASARAPHRVARRWSSGPWTERRRAEELEAAIRTPQDHAAPEAPATGFRPSDFWE